MISPIEAPLKLEFSIVVPGFIDQIDRHLLTYIHVREVAIWGGKRGCGERGCGERGCDLLNMSARFPSMKRHGAVYNIVASMVRGAH